ncbi:MAG: ATP-binding protein [Proteobacteria bacterium]|nr:ATP-binding protein [Pseudomonadota bacterium]
MDQTEETNNLLQKLQPMLGRRTKALWYHSVITGDRKASKRNLELLKLLADKHASLDYQEQIRLPPPDAKSTAGKYRLGTVIYPDRPYSEFGLADEEMLRHLLIVGMTGTGKTNQVFQLLGELGRHRVPVLIFDWKQNYRQLKKLSGFENLRVIRLGDPDSKFYFNPLIPPPGVNPRHWMAMLIDVCKHSFFLGHGVEYLMRKGIDQLYSRYRVYEGSRRYPTFIELEQLLVKEYVRGREMLWMSSAKRAVASLTFKGILREILNVHENGTIQDLLSQNVVIEMDNLATLEKTFMVESLMLWLYYYKKWRGRRSRLDHVTVIEEAHHVLSARKERAEGEETIIESTLRMIREFGEGVVVIDQEPSKLSESVIANTNTKVCFNLGSGKDVAVMEGAMNLTAAERRYIDKLHVGEAIVKSKNRFSNPLLVRIPYVRLRGIEKL